MLMATVGLPYGTALTSIGFSQIPNDYGSEGKVYRRVYKRKRLKANDKSQENGIRSYSYVLHAAKKHEFHLRLTVCRMGEMPNGER